MDVGADWRVDLDRWLEPFLTGLNHAARRSMCPHYIAGLIGLGERKSMQPMAARQDGVKRVVLLLDNAGWHTLPNLAVPDGLRLVHLPPYSPELQPAETLWTLVDEPIVNSFVPNLDKLIDTITERCSYLTTRQPEISSRTNFAWWPKNQAPV